MLVEMPEFFSLRDGYAHYCLAGEHTFESTVAKIDESIRWCRDNMIDRLLVDIRELTGFPPPTTVQRFEFATRWAATASGHVAVSFIAPPVLIDPDKIGMTMANNRGMQAAVFTEEADAIAWLESQL